MLTVFLADLRRTHFTMFFFFSVTIRFWCMDAPLGGETFAPAHRGLSYRDQRQNGSHGIDGIAG